MAKPPSDRKVMVNLEIRYRGMAGDPSCGWEDARQPDPIRRNGSPWLVEGQDHHPPAKCADEIFAEGERGRGHRAYIT
jgi:hypothetical protein